MKSLYEVVNAVANLSPQDRAKLLDSYRPIGIDKGNWYEIDESIKPPDGMIVLGYSPNWVDEDFNPTGVRECFLNEGEWNSCKWDNDQDTWWNDETWQQKTDGPPTHFMLRPEPPMIKLADGVHIDNSQDKRQQ
jgi:hypothetical protein